MPYDEALAERMRRLLTGVAGTTEQKMFGGVAFLIDGRMAVVASGKGGMMIRVDPADAEELVVTTPARFAEMRGRPMRGWLRLESAHVIDDRELAKWVAMSRRYVLSSTRRV